MNKTKWLLTALVIGAAVISVGFFVGWEIAAGLVMASGTILGVTLGAYFGDRKAREVDVYRDQWIAKRVGRKTSVAGDEDPVEPKQS